MLKKEMENQIIMEFEFPVEQGKIREFANAICDKNPIYTDVEYATSKNLKNVLMPPTFPFSFPLHLPSDNFVMEKTIELGLDVGKSVHGETEFNYDRPICAGEVLKGVMTVGKMYEKEGKKGGKMKFVEMVISFFDSENKRVALNKNVFIERS